MEDHPFDEPPRLPSEDKWRAIFAHSLDAILIVDDERRFTDANPAACELLGATLEQLIGAAFSDYLQPAPRPDLPDTTKRWLTLLRDGHDSKECIVHRPGGEIRYAAVYSRANFLPGQHLYTARDITERKSAEGAIRATEQFYRTLIETTGTGYVIADAGGNVIDANSEYLHLTGHRILEEIRGRNPLEWTAPQDRERFGVELALCHTFGKLRNLEIDFVHADGGTVPVELNATMVHTDEGSHLLSLCHDITGRLHTRRELQNASLQLESRVERRTAELARANEQIRSHARLQEAVAELGRDALAGAGIDTLMQRAVETVAKILDVEFSDVLEHADPAGDQLVYRAGVGWPRSRLGQVVASTETSLITGHTLQSHEPVIFENLATESRFRPLPGWVAAGLVSGLTVRIDGETHPYGTIGAQSRRPRRFTADEARFLRSVANVLATAVARHRSDEIVRQAQQSAIQANNAKLDFLSRMSHELRTPLNAILGFSQLLEIERLSGGQRESVEQITLAGRHLLELVNEVLDISRIDSGNISLTPEPLAVDELLREALDLIRPLADARSISLVAGPGCQLPGLYVLADRQRLRQVLLNLLSNAVKYNRAAGQVTLDGAPAPDGKHFRLSVRDTGEGIAPENLSRLFTPFERLGAEKTDVEGSGMGLALSKRLVESQHGELGVESEPGIGSVFWADLPVAATPVSDDLLGLFDELVGQVDAGGPECTEPSQTPSVPVAPEHTILHIEDNEPNRRLVEMLVAQRPTLRLLTASKGEDGLALARAHHPDLILLDLHLPDTSGDDVLQTLRAEDGTRDTPVVMVSADAAAVRRSQDLEVNGANSYLTKPFNVAQFLKLLDDYFERTAA